MKASQC